MLTLFTRNGLILEESRINPAHGKVVILVVNSDRNWAGREIGDLNLDPTAEVIMNWR